MCEPYPRAPPRWLLNRLAESTETPHAATTTSAKMNGFSIGSLRALKHPNRLTHTLGTRWLLNRLAESTETGQRVCQVAPAADGFSIGSLRALKLVARLQPDRADGMASQSAR